MILRYTLFLGTLFLVLLHPGTAILEAQTTPREGIGKRPPRVHALEGARIIPRPGKVIEKGTIILRDGIITAVGEGVRVPADARIWDMSGLTITAGFVDMDLRVNLENETPPSRQGLSWNPRIRPERNLARGFQIEEDLARGHREIGFTSAVVSPAGGILAGNGILISLDGERDGQSVIRDSVAAFAALEYGRSGYPGSMMGAMALLRQTLHDARWYREAWAHHEKKPQTARRPEVNHSLAALAPILEGKLPVAMRSSNALQLLAISRIAEEFNLKGWCLGSGEEYLWLDLIAKTGLKLVIPVNFPEPPKIENPDDAERVSLRQLESWARAPENGARLDRAGISFALTPRGLQSTGKFPAAIRKLIQRGLSAKTALSALTTVPAQILGLEDRLGSLAPGMIASLAVFDGDPFDADVKIREVWIDGNRYPAQTRPSPDLRGKWKLSILASGESLEPIELSVQGSRGRSSLKAKVGEKAARHASLDVVGTRVRLTLSGDILGRQGFVRLVGIVTSPERMEGDGALEDGTRVTFESTRTEKPPPRRERPDRYAERWKGKELEPLATPLGARGRTHPPLSPESILIRGGTIWTCGDDGIVEADLLVRGGKIEAIGKGISPPPGAHIIDASGKHVTPGLIDAHSHTAILGGVNEGGQAVTAEVRIGDVIRPDDISLYRQLAGGLTCAHLLHGSANPIGGQSAIIKLRWGEGPEGLKFEGAHPSIKFALGENPKRSNSSSPGNRYPQSRMGVEQIIREAFLAARRYQREWKEARGKPREKLVQIPRRDLELDALVEILEGKRSIHCHSYRQDEILMLIRLGEEMGFRVGTFQHVLEGYKVAPEMARHGAAASTFSDWWAYKFEVYDAIPYNGALLHRAGVLTSFNSDSSELARRLNLEAAKAVKYGRVPRAEALKFVTLNPARQLRVDDRVGSLEPGKDADLVIWSGDPLSTYTLCLETWIEGKRRFSRDEDRTLEEVDNRRRQQLIQLILEEAHGQTREKEDGEKKVPPDPVSVTPGKGGES